MQQCVAHNTWYTLHTPILAADVGSKRDCRWYAAGLTCLVADTPFILCCAQIYGTNPVVNYRASKADMDAHATWQGELPISPPLAAGSKFKWVAAAVTSGIDLGGCHAYEPIAVVSPLIVLLVGWYACMMSMLALTAKCITIAAQKNHHRFADCCCLPLLCPAIPAAPIACIPITAHPMSRPPCCICTTALGWRWCIMVSNSFSAWR